MNPFKSIFGIACIVLSITFAALVWSGISATERAEWYRHSIRRPLFLPNTPAQEESLRDSAEAADAMARTYFWLAAATVPMFLLSAAGHVLTRKKRDDS